MLTKLEFIADEERWRQNGSGRCAASVLNVAMWRWDGRILGVDKLANELALTESDGLPDHHLTLFLRAANIPHFEESNCSLDRLKKIMRVMDEERDSLIVVIWDKLAPRPGYDQITDAPDQHLILLTPSKLNWPHITVFDPDSFPGYGGVHTIVVPSLIKIWHGGPGSVWGLHPEIGDTYGGQRNVAWLIYVGKTKDEIYRRVLPPDYKNWERKRFRVTEFGILVPEATY